ncbi:hypothetical protein ACLM45_09885 [Synechococcus sp. A10-1-5-9]|uniref:hypothetical protein n=1 Tax=Synechococcus sp. A10-1-5-9 TaxID=3392295 RepID=UPI0039EAAD1B
MAPEVKGIAAARSASGVGRRSCSIRDLLTEITMAMERLASARDNVQRGELAGILHTSHKTATKILAIGRKFIAFLSKISLQEIRQLEEYLYQQLSMKSNDLQKEHQDSSASNYSTQNELFWQPECRGPRPLSHHFFSLFAGNYDEIHKTMY